MDVRTCRYSRPLPFVLLLTIVGGGGSRPLKAAAASSLAAGSANASGGIASVPLAYTSGTGNTASIQWALDIPGATSFSVTASAAVTAAGKRLYCNGNRCLLVGLGSALIPNGVVATVSVSIPATATSPLPVQLYGVIEALPNATGNTVIVQNGSISVSSSLPSPGSISSVGCAAASLNPGQSTACTVTLSGPAATGGQTVTISSSPSSVQIPPSVTVPSSATTASFTLTVPAGAGPATIVLTAATGGASRTTSIQVTAPTTTSPTTSAPQLSALVCSPVSASSSLNGLCTIRLTAPAPVDMSAVIASSDSAVTVPSSARIGAGTLSGRFPFSSTAGTSVRTVAIAATVGGISKVATVTATGVLSFHIKGSSAEVAGTANPAGGEVQFMLRSKYPFAERQALATPGDRVPSDEAISDSQVKRNLTR